MLDARLWKPLPPSGDLDAAALPDADTARVQCRLCSHYCIIPGGGTGRCGVRVNRPDMPEPDTARPDTSGLGTSGPGVAHGNVPVGRLFTLVGDNVAAVNLDPVEKKPLFHFMPGTLTWSFGTMGCNLACSFCQNWSLSRPPAEEGVVRGQRVTPAKLVAEAKASGAASVSFTYSEPTIFFELMSDTADAARAAGLATIMVSNGFQSPECLAELEHRIDAANIDLKAFTEHFYASQCGARLKPVLHTLRTIARMGWWLEVTTLLIPGLNDAPDELRDMARFIRDELGPDVPWHLSRFHPAYQLTDRPPTPPATLERAWEIGQTEGLRFVYLGNMPGHPAESTHCPACGALFARREGFHTHLPASSRCARCGAAMPGVGWDTPEN
ncbi:AmmeMemoRadiSam system radical SAM enzyme [Nitratidesulfovibrio termitidis]|uniref:AmmeMemoRadiSam system radical SAM enzyme n=1 Tax=Nitratidesulfovibrio termitidis TaxID=42252 RepID=UPI00042538BB|nr:AmmeMemoRadiSam system radical SAM enzyme [Nitratidesulfovibrio termitidis]